jgi:predicted DNA-binding transcriptional regulator YafY
MNRLERLYAINETLRRRAPAPVSAATLADEFGVTKRTIERDLVALRYAGVPLDADVGRTGGYRLAPSKGTAVFSLGPEEVVALLLAARSANGMPFAAAANTATQRLLDALPLPTRVAVDELRTRIRAASVHTTPVKRSVLRATEPGVRDRLVMRVKYTDRDGTETSREVEAHGFYGAADGWFLVGWCRLRSAGRIFRLDRITRATTTKEVAPVRDLDDLLGWVPRQTSTP